jgi:hypothetical protein
MNNRRLFAGRVAWDRLEFAVMLKSMNCLPAPMKIVAAERNYVGELLFRVLRNIQRFGIYNIVVTYAVPGARRATHRDHPLHQQESKLTLSSIGDRQGCAARVSVQWLTTDMNGF